MRDWPVWSPGFSRPGLPSSNPAPNSNLSFLACAPPLLAYFGLDALNTPVYAAFAFANAAYDRVTLGRAHPISLYGAAFLIGLDLLVSGMLLLV